MTRPTPPYRSHQPEHRDSTQRAPFIHEVQTTLDALILSPEVDDLPAYVALREQALAVQSARDILMREVAELRRLVGMLAGHN